MLFEYLRDLIYNPSKARLDVSQLPEEFVMLGKGLVYYAECVAETTALARDLSKGELDGKTPSRGNEIASPLKSLQASLKHLTWQTQQVAKGDYKQRVAFMGTFADSFNSMIEQLDVRREALLNEIEISRRKSEALLQNNSLLEAITEHISQWIVVMSKQTSDWLYSNREVESILSDPNSAHELRRWLCERVKESPEGRTMQTESIELPGADGPQYFSVAIHPINWYEHEAAAFVFMDVSDEKKHLRKLETVAYHDTLTKTFNRHYGMEILTEWLEEGSPFVICFVDMDNLKYVNDKFGHAEGDAYILKVVETLRAFSNDAIICRLGGDEFMLLSRSRDMVEAEETLEALRDGLINESRKPGNMYNHSMSYGVIQATIGGRFTASELLAVADEKMYEYKRAHKMQRPSTTLEEYPII
jgi:diguanylate cyclase (GGDEF)-like protein